MDKKPTRRESREAAFLTAFAATFEPEMPTLPAEELEGQPDAFAAELLAAMNAHSDELDSIITDHLKGWTLSRVPRVSLVALRLALAEMLYGKEQKPGVAINEAVELVKNTALIPTTSLSTACWVRWRASRTPSLKHHADPRHRYQ